MVFLLKVKLIRLIKKLLGKALKGNKKGLWRYRVNKFRIICKLEEDQLIILVVTVAKRDVIYED